MAAFVPALARGAGAASDGRRLRGESAALGGGKALWCVRRLPQQRCTPTASAPRSQGPSLSQRLSAAAAVAAVAAALGGTATPPAPTAPQLPLGVLVRAASAEVLQAPVCIEGEGPGCDANADDNALVKKLLESTRANKEKSQTELRERYWQRGYGDYFSFGYDKKLVKGDDGKWSLQDPDDPFLKAARRIQKIINESKEADQKEAAK